MVFSSPVLFFSSFSSCIKPQQTEYYYILKSWFSATVRECKYSTKPERADTGERQTTEPGDARRPILSRNPYKTNKTSNPKQHLATALGHDIMSPLHKGIQMLKTFFVQRFATELQGLLQPGTPHLPPNKTLADIEETIKEQIGELADRTEIAQRLRQGTPTKPSVFTKAFVPTTGIHAYIRDAQKNKLILDRLNVDAHKITNETIIQIAQAAVHQSSIPVTTIVTLETKWEATAPKTIQAFLKLYGKYLKGYKKLNSDDQTERLTALTARLDDVEDDLQTINNNEDQLAASLQRIETTTATAASTITQPTTTNIEDMVVAAVTRAMAAAGNNTNRTNTNTNCTTNTNRTTTNTAEYDWRQYLFWCFSCSANLTHNSEDCTSRYKKRNHRDDATFENKMGGGHARKDQQYMLWWDPNEPGRPKTLKHGTICPIAAPSTSS